MNQNVPTIASSSYASAAYAGNDMAFGLAGNNVNNIAGQAVGGHQLGQVLQPAHQANPKGNPMATARRLVQVCIVDPNENVPLDKCMLFKGGEKLTDATDQELFFEIDIRDILEKHNLERIKIIDKKVKDRTEHLEPAKIRDLKMVVVNIASF